MVARNWRSETPAKIESRNVFTHTHVGEKKYGCLSCQFKCDQEPCE